MKLFKSIFYTSILLSVFSCKTANSNTINSNNIASIKTNEKKQTISVSDTVFENLTDHSKDFILEMKYATNDNFLNSKVYDCASCYLRIKTIKSLIKANEEFLKKGYRIKLFDCYRPLDVQKKMWKIVPNATYVANPKRGSIHNRGGAVDITIVDKQGNELDMGTKFDHFGPESSHLFTKLSSDVIKNRKLLKKIMIKNGFESLDSEWWHYNLKDAKKDALSNFSWNCN